MQTKIEKQPKSTIKLTVTVPVEKVKEMYNKVLSDLAQNIELPGFRKGMAPVEMVKEKTDPNKLYGEVINELLQTYYMQAVKDNNIAPVSNPRVEVKQFDMEKDFEFSALVPVKPEVKVGNFRGKLKELQEQRMKEAREANASKLSQGEPIEEPHVHLSINEVVDTVLGVAETEIPDMLVEDETERMLTRLVDQAQSINLSLDQYLKAQNTTAEKLKEDYNHISEKTIKSEFVLGHLVKEENITVDDEEIEAAVMATGDERALAQLNNPIEKWYIRSVLEKNKLINKLIEEAAGHEHK